MYKNKNDQLECWRKWYKNNRASHIKKTKIRRKLIRNWFNNYRKNLKCSNCSENHSACLDFHHKDSKSKDKSIAVMVEFGYSKKRILAEIKKCKVLCSNCHRKLHWENNTFGKHTHTK